MEIGTILCVGGGLAVIAVGATLCSKSKIKRCIEANNASLSPLMEKIHQEFSISKWTEVIVTINNKSLTKWWNNIVKKNANDEYKVKKELVAILAGWGFVTIATDIEVKINKNQARRAFLEHIDEFAPYLSTLNNESFDRFKWTEIIVTINDNDLIELWKKYVSVADTQERWTRLLASWQIKSDNCKSFTCVKEDNILAYTLPNGDAITIGAKYKVESSCWVQTLVDEEGNVEKKIISKGIVVPFEV